MKGKGITQKDLGSIMGVKAGTISYRLRNDAFKDHEINFICGEFGINPKWVKIGIGEIYAEDESNETYAQNSKSPKMEDRSLDYYVQLVNGQLNDAIAKEKDIAKKELIQRISDLEIMLLRALDGEKTAMKREREITDKYLKLLEKVAKK